MFLTEVRTDPRGLKTLEEAVYASGNCRIVERIGKLIEGEPRWTAFIEHPYSWSLENILEPIGYLGSRWYGYVFHPYSQVRPVI